MVFPETDEDRIPLDYRERSCPRWVDLLIAWFAERQWGRVARWQLREVGVDKSAVSLRVARGQLVDCGFPGVLAVGHRGWGKDARRLTAVLSVGPEARLAARSGCANWGLIADERAVVDVVTDVRGRADRRGVTLHRVTSLADVDVTVHDGKPTTSVALSVLQARAEPDDIEEMLEQALTLHLYDQAAFDDVLERHRGARGSAQLALVLGRAADDPDELRSKLERRFRTLVRKHGLPKPSYNHPIGGRILDAYYEQARLAIELDSRRWHERRRAFRSDRQRDRRLLVDHRVTTMRLTWADVRTDAAGVAADVDGLLKRAQDRSR